MKLTVPFVAVVKSRQHRREHKHTHTRRPDVLWFNLLLFHLFFGSFLPHFSGRIGVKIYHRRFHVAVP